MPSRVVARSLVLVSSLLLLPAAAFAQGAITGVVRDVSGAVLPGVTVEAASPVLIEKVRSVDTDASGQYRIVDLRPGTYSVTFSLPGFRTVRRDGIELTGTFVATVSADLSVGELQDAMTRGTTTSEDIVREYLARLARFDRNGPVLRAMLGLNRRVVADARASDAERAAGRVRGPFHGVPIAFKDNIDVLGLPSTGGSLALIEHVPRLDSKMAAGMRAGGAIVLGKTNLDEFPFGDFGISSVAGTIGNAYDPTLSTAGSSGGTAVAVASGLVTLGFGTDTCNSLSNPAAFASLATSRVRTASKPPRRIASRAFSATL